MSQDPVTSYALAVVEGRQLAGRLIRLACQRHLDDLERGQYQWKPHVAQRVLDLISLMPHVEGEWAGQNIVLEPWQCFTIGSTFGWYRQDGTRRFRSSYNEVARKNAKTTCAAAIGLILAFFDNEPGAQVYCAATKHEQARITHRVAMQMVKGRAALRNRLKLSTNNIADLKTNSRYAPLASDHNSLDGLNVHGALCDEVHAWQALRGLYDVLDTAKGARRQPLIYVTTTAGHDRQSLWWELREYSIKVLEGAVVNDSWAAFIYTLDDGDDWQDESVWIKANPNLGVSVKLDDLREQALKAKQLPAAQNAFLRLRMNCPTENSTRWLDLDLWRSCEADVNLDELAGEPCFLGLDLAQYIDVTAAVLYFPSSKTVLPFFWLPKESMYRRVERDRVPYDVWAREGYIRLTEGNKIDQEVIRRDLNELVAKYQIREVLIDPWNAAVMENWLIDDGFQVKRFAQTHGNMSPACKELEAMLLDKNIRISRNPVMRWMAGNVSVRVNSDGHCKPDRDASGEKIDGITAMLMALGAAVREREQHLPSFEFV